MQHLARTVDARMLALRLHRTFEMSLPAFLGSRTVRNMSSFSSSSRTKNKPRLLRFSRERENGAPSAKNEELRERVSHCYALSLRKGYIKKFGIEM